MSRFAAQSSREPVRALALAVQTLILHPFLMLDEAWLAAVRRLLALIASLARDGTVRVGPGGRFCP